MDKSKILTIIGGGMAGCEAAWQAANMEAFGVWTEKSMYGKTYMGIERSTFLIDGHGNVVKEWRKVKIKDHVADVLSAIANL